MQNVVVKGYRGTWSTICTEEYNGKEVHVLCNDDERLEDICFLTVDDQLNVIKETLDANIHDDDDDEE